MNIRTPTRSSNVERRRNAVPRCLRQLLCLEFRETQVEEACKVMSVCVSATYTITVHGAMTAADGTCFLSICYHKMDLGFSLCSAAIVFRREHSRHLTRLLQLIIWSIWAWLVFKLKCDASHLLLVALTPLKSRYNNLH
jgi:hypothetical protein